MTDQNSTVAEVIETLQRQWVGAYTECDAAFLNLCMSEDYVGIYPDGSVHDKKSEIEAIASGAVVIEAMEPEDMVVRVYDDAAVNTGKSSVKVVLDGEDMRAELRFTSVWVKRGNQWRVVTHQVTGIE